MAMIDRPALLLSGPMRDYCLALERRDEWIELGPHYAPCFLVGRDRKVTCHIYALPAPAQGDIVPQADVDRINETFFCARKHNGCDCGQWIFSVVQVAGLALPVLRLWLPKDVREVLGEGPSPVKGIPMCDFWWTHPSKRIYDRVVIVPRGEKPR